MYPNHQKVDTWAINIFKIKLFSYFIFDYNDLLQIQKADLLWAVRTDSYFLWNWNPAY